MAIMNISLSAQTQKLLEEQMKAGKFHTPDQAVHSALQALGELRGKPIEALDEQTQDALERAFAQSDRGEGMPWEEVRGELVQKYLRSK
jgi:Arc/MetJ-type ribon-helix-helix transcriptional regulator